MVRMLAVLLLSFLITYTDASAKLGRRLMYKAKVYDLSGKLIRKGLLYDVGDSAIFLIENLNKDNLISKKFDVSVFPIYSIGTIKLHQCGQAGINAALGALVGVVSGISVGLKDEDASLGESLALSAGLAMIFAPVGAIVGAVIREHIIFHIAGSYDNYYDARDQLQPLTVKPLIDATTGT